MAAIIKLWIVPVIVMIDAESYNCFDCFLVVAASHVHW